MRPSYLTTDELDTSLLRWLRLAQELDFAEEIEALSRGSSLSSGSPLRTLRLFLGPDRLLRVGGRLALSQLAYEERHPRSSWPSGAT